MSTAWFAGSQASHVFLSGSNPITGLDRTWGFQEFEAPRLQDNRNMKVVSLSALRIGRLYPPGNIPGTHFCSRLSWTQGYSRAEGLCQWKIPMTPSGFLLVEAILTLILPRSRTGTVWFYTSTSNKRAARPKLYTESLTRDLKLMYSRLTVVRISINL